MKRTVGNNEWLDIDVLDDYLEGKLDASMMHKVERISLEDPFVAQALAGLTEAKKRTETLSLLQKQLQERIAEKPAERKMWRIASHRLSIAATAAVLFLTVSVLFWMRENYRQQQAELAANNKSIEIDLKASTAVVAQTDTLAKSRPETILDQERVETALAAAVAKGNKAVAKNNAAKEQTLVAATLADKQFKLTRLKQAHSEKPAIVIAPATAAPISPVQTLNSRVEGIQIKTDPYAKSVKGTIYDIYGRPLSGVDVKMVGNDLRAITNVSGEFTLPIDKDSNKVTLEVASLGFAKKNVEAKADERLAIRLEQSGNALNEIVIAKAATSTTKKAKAADNVMVSLPEIGWKAYNEYLIKSNKLYVNGATVVTLSFMILADGSPSDIKVLKSGGKNLDNEAISLLTNGSKWQLPAGAKPQTSIDIRF